MPDKRKHRGADPDDHRRFRPEAVSTLRVAAADYCWLLSRGYASHASLKLVGDRFQLDDRQRSAIARAACSDVALGRRVERRVPSQALEASEFWIDGFNVITTVEAALGGAVVVAGRDSCFRDLLGVHGSYRSIEESSTAVDLVASWLLERNVGRCVWLLDAPVSNSGRLRAALVERATAGGWLWEVRLEMNPDAILKSAPAVVATADSVILDGCGAWLNLARGVIEASIPNAWILDLFGQDLSNG